MREKFFVSNYAEWMAVLPEDIHVEREPSVFVVNHGIILPAKAVPHAQYYKGGVCSENFEFITGLGRTADYSKSGKGWGEVLDAYKVEKEDLDYVDETVVFGGVFIGQFGHMMLENLNRLWWHIKHKDSSYRIVFIVSACSASGYKSYFWDFLKLLDIPTERILFLERPTQFREIIVPEEAAHESNEYMSEWLLPHKYIKENALKRIPNISQLPKKVYFTKRFYSRGGESTHNEEYFEAYYQAHGFQVIVPENLSVTEQIATVANADEFVTTVGTTGVFILFAKDSCKVTLLTRSEKPQKTQCFINNAIKCDISLVDVSFNFMPTHQLHGIHFLAPNESWREYILQTYGEKLSDNKISSAVYWEYFLKWLKFHLDPPHFVFQDLDCYDILERMARVLLGRKLDKSKYNVVSKSQLCKDRDVAKKQSDEIARQKDIEILATRKKYEKAVAELQSIKNSLSFRVGRLITFFPRKIRDAFTIKRNK